MPPPAPTPRYFDVLRLLFFRRNSFHLRRYTRASRESFVQNESERDDEEWAAPLHVHKARRKVPLAFSALALA